MSITAPTDIANCVLWLDATQETYADGAAVTTWTDRSGSGNSATQATAGATPTFRTGIQNGLPALQFDGTNDHMDLPGLFNLQAGTSFAVARPTTTAEVGYLLGFRTGGGGRWYMVIDSAPSYQSRVGSVLLQPAGADTEFHAWWLRANGNAKDTRVSCLGTASGTDTTTGTTAASGGIGSLLGTQEWWEGYMGEIVHYSRALTAVEAFSVYRYLCAKWGLPTCLGGPTVGYISPGAQF